MAAPDRDINSQLATGYRQPRQSTTPEFVWLRLLGELTRQLRQLECTGVLAAQQMRASAIFTSGL